MKLLSSLGWTLLVTLSPAAAQITLPPQASVDGAQNLKGITICYVPSAGKEESTVALNAAIKTIAAKYKMPLPACNANSKYMMLMNVDGITEQNSGMSRYSVGFSVVAFSKAFPAPVTIYRTNIDNLVPRVALIPGVTQHTSTTMEQLAKAYSEANK